MSEPGPGPTSAALPALPHDRCQRCGRPTPQDVGLCEVCNPGRIGAPGSTQLHATILGGVAVGFVGLALLARLATAGVGPFTTQLGSVQVRTDGGVDVTFTVHNAGSRTAAATCRVTRGGVSAPDDIQFLTPPLAAGATASFSRSSTPPTADTPPYQAERLVIRCT
jgi:hypothetical protein